MIARSDIVDETADVLRDALAVAFCTEHADACMDGPRSGSLSMQLCRDVRIRKCLRAPLCLHDRLLTPSSLPCVNLAQDLPKTETWPTTETLPTYLDEYLTACRGRPHLGARPEQPPAAAKAVRVRWSADDRPRLDDLFAYVAQFGVIGFDAPAAVDDG